MKAVERESAAGMNVLIWGREETELNDYWTRRSWESALLMIRGRTVPAAGCEYNKCDGSQLRKAAMVNEVQ